MHQLLKIGGLALAAAATAAHADCATSVAGMRGLLQDPVFPLRWEETGMSDARPLLVSLEERGGGLFISFVKTGEGTMAEGPARICRTGDQVEARFLQEGLQLGAAAGVMLRAALRSGAAVSLQRLPAGRLRIGTFGWAGDFVPGTPGIGLRTQFGSF